MSSEKNSQSFPKKKKTKNIESFNHSFPKREEIIDEIDSEEEVEEKLEKLDNIVCSHIETTLHNGVNICVDCGEQINEFYSNDKEWRYYGESDNRYSSDPARCQFRKNPDKGIKKELEKMGFSVEISNIADQLYLKVTNGDIKRSNLRKGIMFACVFNACKEKGDPQIPEELQKKFQIDRKNMSKGLTYYHMRCPNRNNSTYITVEHFIPKVMEKFNAKQHHIEVVLKLYEVVKNSSSILIRSNPQSVSSSLVYYYLKKLDPEISINQYSKVVGLSEITILRIINEIEGIISKEKV